VRAVDVRIVRAGAKRGPQQSLNDR